MAEEMSQEERVKNHQVSIAKSMKVHRDVLEVLQNVQEWHIREWLYVCGLDEMPAEQIRMLAEENASLTKIKKARKDFLRNRWTNTGHLEQQVEQMREEVTSVCAASKKARSIIENGLEEALKKQSQAQEAALQAKDQVIQMLQEQLSQIQYNPKPAGDRKELPEQTKKDPEKGIFEKIRKSLDTKRFIRDYIQNNQYTQEQKEYFLKCLEEGMTVKKIERIAAPGLSVEVMQRLRELKQADR